MLSLSVGLLAAESPFSGTWKLNTSKGHLIAPAMKSSTAQIDADQENFKLKQDFVDDKDQSSTATFEAKFDGKDYPVNGDPNIDSVSARRVNDRQLFVTFKKAGKVVATNSVSVSKDGKTTTCKYTDHSEAKPKEGTYVYEKQ
jgi:hypothetical protein